MHERAPREPAPNPTEEGSIPAPIIPTPDEHASDARVDHRQDHDDHPLNAARGIITGLALSLAGILVILLALWITPSTAWPHPASAPHPIRIPVAHAKARASCPFDKPLKCRAALVRAYEAVSWQRKARRDDAKRARGYGVMHALRLASALYNVPLRELIAVGTCESHLHPTSKNTTSTASGVFQFLDSTWNRAGLPGFSVFDAYANTIAAARLVSRDGSWREWACKP